MGDIITYQMINECCLTESYSVVFVPTNWQKHDLAPFLPHLPQKIPTTTVSHYLSFFFFYFVSTKVRDKNFIVLIVKIIMTLVVVVVRIIVVRMITTTNNGGFQFLECPECTDTVLISILSPCNNPWGKCYSHFKV